MAIQKTIIDLSGRKGLSSKFFGDVNRFGYTGYTEGGDPSLRYLASDGETVSGIANPVTKYGYLSPSANTFLSVSVAGAGTAINKTIGINLVDEPNRDLWFACNNSHIYFSTNYYNTSLTDAVTVSTALTTLVQFTDSCSYTLNGTSKLFFAWVGSSNGYISTLDPGDSTGATWNEDWSSADVTNTISFISGRRTLSMVPSGDSFMYILNNSQVHRLDGTTIGGAQGTLYQNVLQGNGNMNFSSGIEYKNKLYLVVRRAGAIDDYTTAKTYGDMSGYNDFIGIYIWNKQASFYNSSDFVSLAGVNDVRGMFLSPSGDLRIITVDMGGGASIRQLNGTAFPVVKSLPYGAIPTTRKSIYNHGGFTYWLGIDGMIYGYGSDVVGEKEFLYIVGQSITNGQGTLIGGSLACISTENGDASPTGYKPTDVFWITYATASNNGFVKTFYPFAYDTIGTTNNIARNPGNVFYPPKLLPTLSNVKHINIIMARKEGLASPTQVEAIINFYFNQSATASFSKSVTRADISKGYISIEINKPYVNSIQLGIVHNTNSNIGVADFAPAYAELVYDTTATIK